MTQIRDRVGKPRRELNAVKEGVQTRTLIYAYSEATPFGEKVPAREMSFHFWDGVLVGDDFRSSFDEGKTNFDDNRVSEKKGARPPRRRWSHCSVPRGASTSTL